MNPNKLTAEEFLNSKIISELNFCSRNLTESTFTNKEVIDFLTEFAEQEKIAFGIGVLEELKKDVDDSDVWIIDEQINELNSKLK